ncbi:hypothetical protein AUJ84_01650 [Candidatus Pacearchaeota archaeon CG1_02_32_132]|nr:MAG: hypothetical protein AUJ84_01650 [Candidatus Pacearchaeota archaeon CG1_02_32_132]
MIKEGWQCHVEVYDDYVIKRFKTKKEIGDSVRRYLMGMGKNLSELEKRVNDAEKDRIYSLKLIVRNKIPDKIIAFPEFLDDTHIKQKKVIEVGDKLEEYFKQNKNKEWKSLLVKIIKFILVLWEYGIHDKSFKFTSNIGLLDDEVVLIDFLELTDNKMKVEKQIRKRKWVNYMEINKKWKRYSNEFAEYFVAKCDEILTIDELNKRWRNKIK